jgi:acetyl-CoA C-acetyltransferase
VRRELVVREAIICEPVRTAVGRYGGVLRDVPPAELAATVLRALVGRTGLTSADIDDVLLGQCYPTSDAPAIGRVAALDAGLDVSVTGMQRTGVAGPGCRPS